MIYRPMTTPEMEIALAEYFNYRRCLIVPNISYGMFNHECDLLVVTKAGYAWEVEIKTSRSDLRADAKKHHQHNSQKISRLYFAIPEKLRKDIDLIPARAGVIVVRSRYACELLRVPERMHKYRFTPAEHFRVAELATLRIWGLKETIERYKREKRQIRL
jgi:hypothetical protein